MCAAAGFATDAIAAVIDPSEYAAARAGLFSDAELADAQVALVEDGVFADATWTADYLGSEFAVSETLRLAFTPESLARVAVKFGWAVAYAAELAADVEGEVEVAFADGVLPATSLEHCFVARELRRRGVNLGALTLRLPGAFEPAIDFEGDVAELERALAEHAAVARFTGSHRIAIRCAEWKFAVLAAIARGCGERLHLRAAGIAWMEAARVIARTEPALFREVLVCAQEHFVFDRIRHAISTSEEDVRFLPDVTDAELERTFLEDPRGRQLLHVTARSILAEPRVADPLQAALAAHADKHRGLVEAAVSRHLAALG